MGILAKCLFAVAFFAISQCSSGKKDRQDPSTSPTPEETHQSGSTDDSFNKQGIALIDYGPGHDYAYDLVLDSQDNAYLAGETSTGFRNDFALVKILPSGKLDKNFGNQGKVATDFHFGHDTAFAIAKDSSGKLILVGSAERNGDSQLAIARFNPDGKIDKSFGKHGRISVSFGQGATLARTVAIDSKGRYVVAGKTRYQNRDQLLITRWYPNGKLDQSFAGTGAVAFPIGSSDDTTLCLAIDANENLILAGKTRFDDHFDGFVAKVTSHGTLGNSFGNEGVVRIDLENNQETIQSLAIDSNNRIVLVGHSQSESSHSMFLFRLQSDGSIDSSFQNGLVSPRPEHASFWAYAVALDSAQRALVAGRSFVGGQSQLLLARWNANGQKDEAFGDGGLSTTRVASGNAFARALKIDSQGRSVIAGYANTTPQDQFQLLAARVHP